MSAPQCSGQLSSCAAPLLHSSLLLAADALLVPYRRRFELEVQTAAACSCTKVFRQAFHLCLFFIPYNAKHAMLTCVQATELAPSLLLA